MVSLIDSIVKKMNLVVHLLNFEKKGNKESKVSGQGNIVLYIGDGNKIDVDALGRLLKEKSIGNTLESENKETIKKLKQNILTEGQEMPIVNLLRKTLTLTGLTGNKDAMTWLTYELNGYPEEDPLTPDYRTIKIRLNIVIENKQGNIVLDLRDDYIPAKWTIDTYSLAKMLESGNDPINLKGPLFPSVLEFFKKQKITTPGGLCESSYLINRKEIETLISKLRQRILQTVIRE